MSFHEFFLNGDYASFEKRICDWLDSFAMRQRPDGVWELDTTQFVHSFSDFVFYDEVAPVDAEMWVKHIFDHSFICQECGISEKEAKEKWSRRACPGRPYRYSVLPFFNYHGRDDGWRVVRTEGPVSVQDDREPDSYITVDEAEKYLKGRLGEIDRDFK